MCNTAIISYDVKNHYISKTDWGKLVRLSDEVMEEVVVAEMGDIDPHIRYMWINKYSKVNLLSYHTSDLFPRKNENEVQ